jgi:NAD(P)-dependent dehydrogenase (short-subunit alcohol dehydrogenase family)
MGRLNDKVCVVTGGASGLGQAAARAMAREGAKVVIADVNAAHGEATAQAIRDAGGEALFVKCDVSQAGDAQALFSACIAQYGQVDALYANAAIELYGVDAKAHELDEAIWDRIMAVNLKGMWLTCKYGLIEMLKRRRGSIILAASPTGLYGLGAGETAYSTSKGGVAGLMRVMAADYAGDGIRINGVVPGNMDTPMNAQALGTPALREEAAAVIPMRRLGLAEDLAGLVVFLASDESSYCTGGFYMCDGGLTAV